MSKNSIVITGASSGFGALAARRLADSGDIVYAGMRETTGRNAPQATAAAYSTAHRITVGMTPPNVGAMTFALR